MMANDEHAAIVRKIGSGARIVDSEPLAGGVSASVTALTIAWPDDTRERIVVRTHRDDGERPERSRRAEREFKLMEVLHANGVPVPKPRLFWPPHTLVIDFVPGSTVLPAEPAGALARSLAALHAVPPEGLPDLPSRIDPLPDMLEWLPVDLIAAVQENRCPPFGDARCLVHGDFWPGNLLWADTRIVALIDWEDALLGDPLLDLAVLRVELFCMDRADVVESLTAEYLALTGRSADRLPYWDLFACAASLHSMGTWGLSADALARRRVAAEAWLARTVEVLGELPGRAIGRVDGHES